MAVRYPQFCALARAAEILGERWTLLIVRELMLGPQRFSDLKASLDGISTSVLTERLAHLEQIGLLRKTYLEPPAASTVYELTEAGLGLKPAIFALIRWGGSFLFPPRPDDRFDPRWMGLALAACAVKGPTPAGTIALRVHERDGATNLRIEGGLDGTVVSREAGDEDTIVATDTQTVLRLISGDLHPRQAEREMLASVEGDRSVFERIAGFFQTSDTEPREETKWRQP